MVSPGADIGYLFYPPAQEHAPGHSRLDVFIREHPTGRHFDPESAQAMVVAGDGCAAVITVRHPWPHFAEYRLCAGRITVADRKGKEMEAFTFGGKLLIEPQKAVTRCALASDAPIIHLIDSFSVEGLLAEETEVLLAERRAAWLADADTYERRLSALEPLTLYVVCLKALDEKFAHSHGSDEDHRHRFLHFLRAEQQRLSDVRSWPGRVAGVEDVL